MATEWDVRAQNVDNDVENNGLNSIVNVIVLILIIWDDIRSNQLSEQLLQSICSTAKISFIDLSFYNVCIDCLHYLVDCLLNKSPRSPKVYWTITFYVSAYWCCYSQWFHIPLPRQYYHSPLIMGNMHWTQQNTPRDNCFAWYCHRYCSVGRVDRSTSTKINTSLLSHIVMPKKYAVYCNCVEEISLCVITKVSKHKWMFPLS